MFNNRDINCLQCEKSILDVAIISFLSGKLNRSYCFTEKDVRLTNCEHPNSCFLKIQVTKIKIVPDNNIIIFDKVIIYDTHGVNIIIFYIIY